MYVMNYKEWELNKTRNYKVALKFRFNILVFFQKNKTSKVIKAPFLILFRDDLMWLRFQSGSELQWKSFQNPISFLPQAFPQIWILFIFLS